MPMIQARRLRKEYRGLVAVKGLDLDLDRGDIFGFIGPNGAGKTTTIKMLATLLTPTAGTIQIDGIDVIRHPEAVRAVVGYMPDFFGVYDDIKVWEYLDFFAAAYRIPRSRRARVVDDVLSLTDLTVKKEAYVESLSRGMKQRLCLAKTLVHDPKVLLLDEPASGLDPRARIEIKELLKELRAMGKTIIVSSHILPELADFCNKIGIIEKGEMRVAGDVADIVRETRGHQVLEIRVAEGSALAQGSAPAAGRALAGREGARADDTMTPAMERAADTMTPAMERAADLLRDLPDVQSVWVSGERLQAAYVGEPDEEWRVLQALVQSGVRVLAFGTQATDLEDLFLQVTRGIVS